MIKSSDKIFLEEMEGHAEVYPIISLDERPSDGEFQLDADETAVLDELAWEQHKLRQNVVRELVRNGLQDYLLSKAWGKTECEND